MDIIVLIVLGFVLTIVLALLIFLYFLRTREEKKKTVPTNSTQRGLTQLANVIKNKQTSAKVLQETVENIIKEYGHIDTFSIYRDILLDVTRHSNTNKNIILYFDKELSKLNPKHKKEISDTVTEGLNAR